VAAIFYNRIVLGLRGREQLPTFSLYGLYSLKDFLVSCVARRREGPSAPSWGSWRRDRNGFGRLPTEEEEAMFNGRFSIDEDDEGARDNQILASGIPPNFAASGGGSGANGDAHEGAIRL
jgi:cation-dependent mannose-6-phosphate receptor